MGCCGSTSVNIPAAPTPPAPTQAETDLTTSETELYKQNLATLQQQQADQEAARTAFEGATGMSYSDYIAKEAKSSYDINQLYADRIQQGLKGELPIDPATANAREAESAQLEEKYAKQLGSGYQTSDPYVRAKKQFDLKWDSIMTAARTGSISEGEQLGYANPGSPVSTGLTQVSQMASPNQGQNLYQYYLANRGMANADQMSGYTNAVNAAMASAGSQGALASGGMGLLGNIFGAAGAAKGFGNLFS